MSGPDHGGCGRLTVVAAPVEQLLAKAVLDRLDTDELAQALAGSSSKNDQTSQLADEITADREQLEELAKLWSDRSITSAEWHAARTPIDTRIHHAERRLATSTNNAALFDVVGRGNALRTQWAGLTLDRQAAIVKTILDHAVIAPGTPGTRSMDRARVTPVWRM